MKLLILNDVVKEIASDELYRVIYEDNKQGLCTLIKLNTNKCKIINVKTSELKNKLEIGNLVLSPVEENYSFISVGEMPLKTKEIYLKKCQIIDVILNKIPEPYLYMKKYRVAGFKSIAKEFGVHERTIKRTILTYLQGGKTKVSLIPQYDKCGAPGKDRLGEVKVGKKRGKVYFNDYVNYELENNGKPIKYCFKNIEKTIKKYILKNSGITIRKAYRLMITEYYTEKNEWGSSFPVPYYEMPTYNQFYYQLQKFRKANFTEYKRLNLGEKKYRLNAKANQSNAVVDAIMPGYVYEIDATRPHVMLLDKHRKNVIGTPVVFYVIDKFSKMIVGISVGLDAPGWNGASSALLNVVEEKDKFALKHNIEITKDQWIDVTMPQTILADNGEFANNLPLGLIEELGITIQNAPSGAGDAKGTVEKLFHLTEQELFGLIPGFSKKNYRDRGEIDQNLKAKYTLEEITQAYINFVKFYNEKELKKYPLSQEMISDGLYPTPNNIWNWMKNRGQIFQVRITEDKIKSALLRRATGKVTGKGVRLFGIYYEGGIAHEEGWFTKAKNMGFYDISVKYDERNLNNIYVLDSKLGKYVKFKMTEASEMLYKELNYSEKVFYDAFRKITSLNYIDEQMYLHVTFYKNIIRLNKLADSKYIEVNFKNKPNTTEKRKNRKLENETVRKEQAISLVDKKGESNSENIIKISIEPDGETFQEKRKKIKRENMRRTREELTK